MMDSVNHEVYQFRFILHINQWEIAWKNYPNSWYPPRSLLSPYLFILCVDALSSMLQKAKKMGNLTRVPIAKS